MRCVQQFYVLCHIQTGNFLHDPEATSVELRVGYGSLTAFRLDAGATCDLILDLVLGIAISHHCGAGRRSPSEHEISKSALHQYRVAH
jgi:hypothetical protein